MKINKFSYSDNDNEKKAIKMGFNIGDTVYNSVAQRRMVITQKNDPRITSSSNFCSLGAVGEFPNTYTKIKSSYNDVERVKLYQIENLKKSISDTYNKAFLTKEELKELVNDYIEKL